LCVYGGSTDIVAGAAVASLSIEWESEIERAKALLQTIQPLQTELNAAFKFSGVSAVYTMRMPQKPSGDAGANPARTLSRTAHRALFAPTLLETPEPLSRSLQSNQVAIWKTTEGRHVVSSVWDSAVLDQRTVDSIQWSNLLPAKGEGRMTIQLNSLVVKDFHSSSALTGLVENLAHITGRKIECNTQYNA
jgi:hypothetical protein